MPRFSSSMPSTTSRWRSLAKMPFTNSIFSGAREIRSSNSSCDHRRPSRLISQSMGFMEVLRSRTHDLSQDDSDCPASIVGLQLMSEAGIMERQPKTSARVYPMRTMLSILLLAALALADEPQVHRDLAYAEPRNERQTLDVSATKEGKNHPIVFWIHGGGWQAGDKSDVQVKPQAFVDQGFVFVSTNYRLLPDASIKEMAGDVAEAIRWVRDHAQEYGGDPDKFFVMGHSAGAQLAALVCTDDRYLKAEGLSFSILKGCVPIDGDTYDVPMQIATVEQERKDAYRRKFGDEASQQALSPVTHVARGKRIPPFLILHVADHPETTAQSHRLVKALQESGVTARAYPAKHKNHGTINADL